MNVLFTIMVLAYVCASKVSAAEFAPPEVPIEAEKYFPEEQTSFASDLWYIFKSAVADVQPELAEAAVLCLSVIAVIIFVSLLSGSTGRTKKTIDIVSVVAVSVILLKPSRSLLSLAMDTVTEITEYSKLLTPVMTGALAAQGGITTSSALYIGTTVFNTVLSALITNILVPLLYIYIAICVADNAIGEKMLKQLGGSVKWLLTWTLKLIIYFFTGYMSITGVVSGCADATAIKAAKLTISGVVPVVGNIISDASDAVLTSAALIKNSAGIYGLLAVVAIWIAPFITVSVHYLLLKLTASICGLFGQNPCTALVDNYASVMGYALAMISVASMLVLISTVCFMKGVL